MKKSITLYKGNVAFYPIFMTTTPISVVTEGNMAGKKNNESIN